MSGKANLASIAVTMHDNQTLVGDLLKAGARGYLLKSDAKNYLIGAIEALSMHKPYFTAEVSEALLHTFLSARAERDRYLLIESEKWCN